MSSVKMLKARIIDFYVLGVVVATKELKTITPKAGTPYKKMCSVRLKQPLVRVSISLRVTPDELPKGDHRWLDQNGLIYISFSTTGKFILTSSEILVDKFELPRNLTWLGSVYSLDNYLPSPTVEDIMLDYT